MAPESADGLRMIEGACPACGGTLSDRTHMDVSVPRCEGCGLFAADADSLQTLARRLRKATGAEAAALREVLEKAPEMPPRVTQGCPYCGGTLVPLMRQTWVVCESCGLRIVPAACFAQIVAEPGLAHAGPVGTYGKLPEGKESPKPLLIGGGIVCVVLGIATAVSYYQMYASRPGTRRVSYLVDGSRQGDPFDFLLLTATVLLAAGIGFLVRAFKSPGEKTADSDETG